MLNRRQFISLSAAASAALRTELVSGVSLQGFAEEESDGFPRSAYTPFGYLDNPWHTWDLHRSGVLRSLPGMGFVLYYPAGPGGYFDFKQDEIYEAHLALGVCIDGHIFFDQDDFSPGQLTAPHHSANLLGYEFEADGVHVTASFVQVGEDAIAAKVRVTQRSKPLKSVRVLAFHTYKLGPSDWWGRDGLAGEFDAVRDALWIRSFAAGTVFAVSGSRPSTAQFFGTKPEARKEWLNSDSRFAERVSYYPEALHGALRYDLGPDAHAESELLVAMARGANTVAALNQARAALADADRCIFEKRAKDASFWSHAPRLTGDWPEHWKHGWTYDFETLRMMVRRPIGVYKHAWDAMQIQAPRNVLAETSIDMWALSYADPESAKAVFLGQFLDALAPNIPCMREDGVMNMVATDGSACGTAISWCFPYFCVGSIFHRTQDVAWLRQIYPGLAALLRWSLKNRTDAGGYLVGKCSWETGMDTSRRFLIRQPTGGELVEFLRLVELQAAAAQAGALLAQFAELVGDEASLAEWRQVERTYTQKTQQLWSKDWFHDFDTRSMQLVTTTLPDPSQAAPAFCGVATRQQMQSMLAKLRLMYADMCAQAARPDNVATSPLIWSSFLLPFLESSWSCGDHLLAAEATAATADRVYLSMDRRSVTENGDASPYERLGWPGVSCEVWGCKGALGGEGYGWGAVMPAHIIRNLIGFRETDSPGLTLICPTLPPLLDQVGKSYGLLGLNYGAGRVDLNLTVLEDARILVQGKCSGGLRLRFIQNQEGHPQQVRQTAEGQWEFEARNGSSYAVRLF